MKLFTLIKTGYSKGVYGCTGEYFTLFIIDGERFESLNFVGLHGAEKYVIEPLLKAGYKPYYAWANHGQVKKKDVQPQTYSKHEAIERVNAFITEK